MSQRSSSESAPTSSSTVGDGASKDAYPRLTRRIAAGFTAIVATIPSFNFAAAALVPPLNSPLAPAPSNTPDPTMAALERLKTAIEAVRSFPHPRGTIEEEQASEDDWRAANQEEFDSLCNLCLVTPQTIEAAAALTSAVVSYHSDTGIAREREDYVFNALVQVDAFFTKVTPAR